ncbi:MarR family winged helix-turn-helix transcriptional regulator [Fictibacillus barbaricus]|uniref:MarR family transcriptional regulator n=1 Tax=Fictibacillus barbaricus TaxID=182136 RepID=A0ABS2Z7V7_9BACL|nr:MarR family transcriptional regulator [Fictibacillus barbaricus]MBN3544154.1 MarR family transcriptional regulator [Fictibacillus barbaricus]
MSRAHKELMECTAKDIKKYKMSGTEFAVLELLYQKGKMPFQEIGNKILITSGSITYNIDKLEKKGYLKRTPSVEDRRVTYADITENGKELIKKIFPDHAKAIHDAMHGLTNEEKMIAIALMKKLGIEASKIS